MAAQQDSRSMEQRLSDDDRWDYDGWYSMQQRRKYRFIGDNKLSCNLYFILGGVCFDAWFGTVLVLEFQHSIVGREDEAWKALESFIAVKDHYETSASARLRCKHCEKIVNTPRYHVGLCPALKPLVKSAHKT